ncbi:hypothetical protein AALO_G00044850 [Alosa alosa]|uniref:Uncharacterized protein n=1 Tax=Alosa alosa TaxID=278164 RepID=A0AAV6H8H8_9TELE|nr:hypothetical protein AALO_G00044850 [Alosa alosa]
MYKLAKFIIKDPLPYWDAVQRIPVPQDLCAQLDRPSMEDAVAEHVSFCGVDQTVFLQYAEPIMNVYWLKIFYLYTVTANTCNRLSSPFHSSDSQTAMVSSVNIHCILQRI